MKALKNSKLLLVTIVTTLANAEKYREMLQSHGATIHSENITRDNEQVFVSKDLKLSDLHLFDKNDGEDCFVHYYEVLSGNYMVQFSTCQTERREKFISDISVFHSNDGGLQKIADIFHRRELMTAYPNNYTLNWGVWGSVTLERAKVFTDGIKICTKLMEDCIKQFVK
jgi:hypothetical protein